ncbi:cytochrome P450 [Embleya sp. NPDC050493]|uniref:cytochrome P450 n=1 Tax=Embleya sp. NPDC050493 TaxID=3363989 RepID=UPI00379D9BC7
MRLDDIDLFDTDRIVSRAPHEELAFLRREAPVWRHPEPNGPGFWVVTKHADVVSCSRDPLTFSSAADRGGVVGMHDLTEDQAALAALEGEVLLYMDPPKHTRYRSLVGRGFAPAIVARLTRRIEALTTSIIDKALAAKTFDFVEDIAKPLPLQVICEILGVPESDRDEVCRWTDRMSALDDEEAAMTARFEMYSYIARLREKRVREPGDDLFSDLLAAADGELSDLELDIFFLLLASAGNETTRNALSAGVHALITHPDQMQRLRSAPELLPNAVEEVLRWATPVMYFRRNVTRETQLRGVTLKAGDKVALSYLSANRDEEVFSEPFRFDVGRSPNEHVSFGGGGPHFCLGASLARIETRLVVAQVVQKMPTLTLAGDVTRLRSDFLNALTGLPVEITRRGWTVGSAAPPPATG